MKKAALLLMALWACKPAFATDSLRVLFIGNSYTAVNNLPDMVKEMSMSNGHFLEAYANTPGGATLQGHLSNSTTQNLIQQGNWDFVVLQEQSQIPAFPDGQVAMIFYPAARALDSLIHVYSPCAKTVFYMTWGRKYGDQDNCASFPPICTYDGMDSMLRLRYTNAADSNSSFISPVGPVWHYLRDNVSNIELYQNDNSHPTRAGTFAAACSFYAIFFSDNPQNCPYNYTLSNNDAAAIKAAAATVVFDSLDYWQRFAPLPVAQFDQNIQGDTVLFFNQSEHADSWSWDFGDGQTDTAKNPGHVFSPGTYTVCLNAIKDCDTAGFCDTLTIMPTGMGQGMPVVTVAVNIYPNPVHDRLHIPRLPENGSSYMVYNLLGREVQSGRLEAGKNTVLLSNLSPGVYFLKLFSGHEIIASGKFQKL
ncbi:MAG TPA: PKD domain-containing protein [Edaphocola sp.]|nr:PKD domain-containing protein [Edaphocola sp.]